MKPSRRTSDQGERKSGGSTLLGLFIGVVLGVLGAAGVVWYINKMPIPFSAKGQQAAAPADPLKQQSAAQPGTPAPLPGKPGDPAPQANDKPRFDFYKILPGNADSVPAPAEKPVEEVKAKVEKEGAAKNVLYLQTGSFQKPDDADNQKAKLALMGMEASVQQVMLQDKVWYRVRLGPFTKIDDVNKLRSELAKQGLDANVVKKD
jgi:cell division protein FtsN